MPILISIICPSCGRTVKAERTAKLTCSECGNTFGFAELQKKRLIIDTRAEMKEMAVARDYFMNAEFSGALKHFRAALEHNKNSYSAQYLASLCEIYLKEGNDDFDEMTAIVEMIRSSLTVMAKNDAPAADKLAFIKAMLNEIKILINKRISRDDLFEADIDTFRTLTANDLSKLTDLFKIDREIIMLYSPDVAAALYEIAENAVKACYRAVQTVIVGEEIITPSDETYKHLSSLCNEYCFIAHSLDEKFDAKNYSPDFTQCNMLNDKVLSRFAKFDENNKQFAKRHLIGDIEEYNSILSECKLALKFTTLSCYRSMCSRQVDRHANLFYNGLELVYRLLLPRVVMNDEKKIEIYTGNFVDVVELCETLTKFVVDSYELSEEVGQSLHTFYERLYEIIDMHLAPVFDKLSKSLNKIKETKNDEFYITQKLLYDGACCCVPALAKYVDFSDGRDKMRERIVKICKLATEDFLLLSGFKIDELEQSNFYRPILQISSALLDEEE